MNDMYFYENKYKQLGKKYIGGCDEAGRGPMAGPLVAAFVILDDNYYIDGLNDSKQLTPKKREELFGIIKEKALVVEYEVVPVDDVDKLNVYRASQYAMEQCILRSKVKPDIVLTDAMPLTINCDHLPIIKGDAKSATIAASSIVAKVIRDQLMCEYDKIYPEYGFKQHKGYVTKFHKEALLKYGPCPIHRKSFAPVKEVIEMIL